MGLNAEKNKRVKFQSWDLLCLETGVHTSPRVVITPRDTLEPRIYCECYQIVYALFANMNVGQHEHVKVNLRNCLGS